MSKWNLDGLKNIANSGETRAYETLLGKDRNIYRDINISLIDSFQNHPYKVLDNDDMEELIESIKTKGQLSPAIVREKANGRYELISGHRRKRALETLGVENIIAEVKTLSDEEAIIEMVDCNLQRSTILPSEKAFSYKMKFEAMKRQGNRSDLTFTQVEQKLNTLETISQGAGESRAQVQRYIRLTELITELLELVDKEEIGVNVGVELSYLPKDEQAVVYEFTKSEGKTPTVAQAKQLRTLSNAKGISEENILEVFVKATTSSKTDMFKLPKERFQPFLKRDMTDKEFLSIVEKALLMYYSNVNKKENENN